MAQQDQQHLIVITRDEDDGGCCRSENKIICLPYNASKPLRISDRCNLIYKMIPYLVTFLVGVAILCVPKKRNSGSEEWPKRVIALSIWLFFMLCVLKRKWILRVYYGKRNFTREKHDYPLDFILKKLHAFISTEEEVARIQEKNRKNLTLVEKVMKGGLGITGNTEHFMAGSTAEGFSLPIVPNITQIRKTNHELLHAIFSDFDYMISCTQDKASFTRDEEKYLVCSKSAQLKPGFVHLFANQDNTFTSAKNLRKLLLNVSKAIRVEELQEDYSTPLYFCFGLIPYHFSLGQVNSKGPAIEIKIGNGAAFISDQSNRFYCDFTFAIKCPQWPDEMSNWVYRPNKLWPDPSNVTRIASYGCHFVPKSQPDDDEGFTWRVSFSRAEVELSRLMPQTARMSLIGLKIITKDYLSVTCSKINSYQLKSLLLYALEETDPQFWRQETNLEQCFHLLFEKLLHAVTNRYCPHFWIPQMNLFENLTSRDVRKVTKQLRKVLESPESYIEDLNLTSDKSNINPYQN